MTTNTWIVLLVGIALALVGVAFFLWSCALKWQERHEALGGLNLHLFSATEMTPEQFMKEFNFAPGDEPGHWKRNSCACDTTNGSEAGGVASGSTAGATGSGSYRKDSAGNTRHDALMAAQRLEREAVLGVANKAQQVAEEAALELMFRLPPSIIVLADILPHEWATMRHALSTAKVGNENTSAWAEEIDDHLGDEGESRKQQAKAWCVMCDTLDRITGSGAWIDDGDTAIKAAVATIEKLAGCGTNAASEPASGQESGIPASPVLDCPSIEEAFRRFDGEMHGDALLRGMDVAEARRQDMAVGAAVAWADGNAAKWGLDPSGFGEAAAKVHSSALKGDTSKAQA